MVHVAGKDLGTGGRGEMARRLLGRNREEKKETLRTGAENRGEEIRGQNWGGMER